MSRTIYQEGDTSLKKYATRLLDLLALKTVVDWIILTSNMLLRDKKIIPAYCQLNLIKKDMLLKKSMTQWWWCDIPTALRHTTPVNISTCALSVWLIECFTGYNIRPQFQVSNFFDRKSIWKICLADRVGQLVSRFREGGITFSLPVLTSKERLY